MCEFQSTRGSSCSSECSRSCLSLSRHGLFVASSNEQTNCNGNCKSNQSGSQYQTQVSTLDSQLSSLEQNGNNNKTLLKNFENVAQICAKCKKICLDGPASHTQIQLGGAQRRGRERQSRRKTELKCCCCRLISIIAKSKLEKLCACS